MATLLYLFVIGLITVAVLGLVLAVLGLVFNIVTGLAGFLLFKVLPILLIGWLVVRFLAPRRRTADDSV